MQVVLDMLKDMQSRVSHTNTTFRGEEACQPVCFFFRERKTCTSLLGPLMSLLRSGTMPIYLSANYWEGERITWVVWAHRDLPCWVPGWQKRMDTRTKRRWYSRVNTSQLSGNFFSYKLIYKYPNSLAWHNRPFMIYSRWSILNS